MKGDDRVINTRVQRTTTIEFTTITVDPALWWVAFGLIDPRLLHDACWDGEAIR